MHVNENRNGRGLENLNSWPNSSLQIASTFSERESHHLICVFFFIQVLKSPLCRSGWDLTARDQCMLYLFSREWLTIISLSPHTYCRLSVKLISQELILWQLILWELISWKEAILPCVAKTVQLILHCWVKQYTNRCLLKLLSLLQFFYSILSFLT